MSVTVLAAVGLLNDAIAVAGALAPLIHNAMAGGHTTVSDAEVQMARNKLAQAISDLDLAIAAKKSGSTP